MKYIQLYGMDFAADPELDIILDEHKPHPTTEDGGLYFSNMSELQDLPSVWYFDVPTIQLFVDPRIHPERIRILLNKILHDLPATVTAIEGLREYTSQDRAAKHSVQPNTDDPTG